MNPYTKSIGLTDALRKLCFGDGAVGAVADAIRDCVSTLNDEISDLKEAIDYEQSVARNRAKEIDSLQQQVARMHDMRRERVAAQRLKAFDSYCVKLQISASLFEHDAGGALGSFFCKKIALIKILKIGNDRLGLREAKERIESLNIDERDIGTQAILGFYSMSGALAMLREARRQGVTLEAYQEVHSSEIEIEPSWAV